MRQLLIKINESSLGENKDIYKVLVSEETLLLKDLEEYIKGSSCRRWGSDDCVTVTTPNAKGLISTNQIKWN